MGTNATALTIRVIDGDVRERILVQGNNIQWTIAHAYAAFFAVVWLNHRSF